MSRKTKPHPTNGQIPVRTPNDYTKMLETDNARLTKENNDLRTLARQLDTMIKMAENSGKITFVTDNRLSPTDEPVIAASTFINQRQQSDHQLHQQRDFLRTLADLRVLTTFIDTVATYASLKDLTTALDGKDEELSTLFTRITRLANEMDLAMTTSLPLLSHYVAARVAGIHRASKDRGDSLRTVVATTGSALKEVAAEMAAKVRQGRIPDRATVQLWEYAKKIKYEEHRTWADTAEFIWQHLDNRRSKLKTDDPDYIILQNLDHQRAHGNPSAFVSQAYHRYEKSRQKNRSSLKNISDGKS